jgi:hypothetical protein
MAGTIQPIAALTAEDHGPINTIVSIVLPVTSALTVIVRISMRQQKFQGYEADDVVFGVEFSYGCKDTYNGTLRMARSAHVERIHTRKTSKVSWTL